MIGSQLVIYSFIVALLTLTPGADTMLVLRNVFSSGKRSGLFTTLGICSGLLIYAFLTAFGISLVLTKSIILFRIIQFLGAGYLVYLGLSSLAPLIKNRGKYLEPGLNTKHIGKTDRKSFLEGLLSNIFNPKIAVFYLTFLPQFINTTDNVLLKSLFLTSIHILMGFIWLSFLSVCIGNFRKLYSYPKLQHTLEALCGTVMIIFGLVLLWERK